MSIRSLFDLSGKVALVVGASGHLGSEIARTLADLGASVVLSSRSRASCEAIMQTLTCDPNHQHHEALTCDVTSTASVEELRDHLLGHYGRGVDVLVNSVWAGEKSDWQDMSDDGWFLDINASLTGTFRMIREFAPTMPTGGSIINIASMYGHVAPDPSLYDGNAYVNPPSYGAAKGGVIQLTRYFASFLARQQIRVNAISPGPFPFGETLRDEAFMEALRHRTLLGRVGNPEDLSGVIALLASNASSFLTGQTIQVDGGWTTR